MNIPDLPALLSANKDPLAADFTILPESRGEDSEIKPIPAKDLTLIANYLEQPTQTGFWRLKAKWQFSDGISDFLYQRIKNELHTEVDTSSKKGIQKKPKYSESDRKTIIDELTSTISDLFLLGRAG